jgi:hypothetical protein
MYSVYFYGLMIWVIDSLTEWLPESKQQLERQNICGKDNIKNNPGKMCCEDVVGYI